MEFFINNRIGIFGEKRIVITPKFPELYDDIIKSIDMRYTDNQERIKDFISGFYEIPKDNIILIKQL